LRATRFTVQGASRAYYDFYLGFGFFVTVLPAFSGLLAWQLAAMRPVVLHDLALLRWAFASSWVIITVRTWRYFLPMPVVSSMLITLGLLLAAWQGAIVPP
jgi:hypothetical protein